VDTNLFAASVAPDSRWSVPHPESAGTLTMPAIAKVATPLRTIQRCYPRPERLKHFAMRTVFRFGLFGGRVAAGMSGYLEIYLNDQLALGIAWRELARRAAHNNRDTDTSLALDRVATGIAEDVDTFRGIMRALGVRVSPVKPGLAWAAERVGRLKLNGRLLGYSPLSRFEELEFLTMGIEGKKQLWVTLRDLAGLGARLPDTDFDELVRRAERQREDLEPHRVLAGTEAFT
jgi:hypothetical protein